MTDIQVANELLKIAAWYSTQTPFGWSSPTCGTLEEAARRLGVEVNRPKDTGDAELS